MPTFRRRPRVGVALRSTLKTIDLLLGVPPNSIQEASATPLTDYFTDIAQPEPGYTVQGAVAAGAPGVPVLADEQEHRLDRSSPDPVRLAANPGGACPIAQLAAQATGDSALPATGRDAWLLIPAAICLALSVLARPRRQRN